MLIPDFPESQEEHPGADGAHDLDSPWIAIDRFVRTLERGHQACDRFSGALATICELTNAQLAFVYSEPDGAVTDRVGVVTPTARWCRDLTGWLITRFPGGGFWRAEAAAGCPELPSDPIPYSAAILPVKAGRPAWLVAIGLDPARPLEDSDLRILKVICAFRPAIIAASASTRT